MRQAWTILQAGLLASACLLLSAPTATASCRVTDFATTPLSSLNEVQRLSFVQQMTQTEYDRLRQAPADNPNHYALIANSADYDTARNTARERLQDLQIQNVQDYAAIWATDYMNDEQLRALLTCGSSRRPGIHFAGRPAGRNTFNLSFVHLTPTGVQRIRLQLVASSNVRNAAQIERALESLGERDNFTVQTLPINIIDPSKRSVLVLRAGWETPLFVYIPTYPWPETP